MQHCVWICAFSKWFKNLFKLIFSYFSVRAAPWGSQRLMYRSEPQKRWLGYDFHFFEAYQYNSDKRSWKIDIGRGEANIFRIIKQFSTEREGKSFPPKPRVGSFLKSKKYTTVHLPAFASINLKKTEKTVFHGLTRRWWLPLMFQLSLFFPPIPT